MSKIAAYRWFRAVSGIVILVVVGVAAYLVSNSLKLTNVQVIYAVTSVLVITAALLFATGLWSSYLPRADSDLEQAQPQSTERSKSNASSD